MVRYRDTLQQPRYRIDWPGWKHWRQFHVLWMSWGQWRIRLWPWR